MNPAQSAHAEALERENEALKKTIAATADHKKALGEIKKAIDAINSKKTSGGTDSAVLTVLKSLDVCISGQVTISTWCRWQS